RLKFGLLRGGDVDLFASSRIASLRRCPRSDRKSSKADETDFVATLQRVGDGVEYRVYSLARLRLLHISLTADGVDEFVSVHDTPLGECAGPNLLSHRRV